MPRRHPRPADPPRGRRQTKGRSIEDAVGPSWAKVNGYVVTSSNSAKGYTCPYCNQKVGGESHLVVYPVGAVEERRHFHSPCWAKKNSLKR